jgi:hypothetical protein
MNSLYQNTVSKIYTNALFRFRLKKHSAFLNKQAKRLSK